MNIWLKCTDRWEIISPILFPSFFDTIFLRLRYEKSLRMTAHTSTYQSNSQTVTLPRKKQQPNNAANVTIEPLNRLKSSPRYCYPLDTEGLTSSSLAKAKRGVFPTNGRVHPERSRRIPSTYLPLLQNAAVTQFSNIAM